MHFRPLNKRTFLLTLLALFAFRLFHGLSLDFWDGDERQIYLLGLQYFTTGDWPFFGPDVIHTDNQIAGALQSILVGLPLHIAPFPETPLVFVNLLSFAGLLLFAAYLCRRFPQVPKVLVYVWLMTLPWTLNISTDVYNPSYLLFASCLFFVALAEILPELRVGLMRQSLAFFLMGFAITWCFQIHLSWPLLLPFVGVGFFACLREKKLNWRQPLAFLVGLAVPGALIIPTAIKYGVKAVFSPLYTNSGVTEANLSQSFTILARFLSFGAYEVPRFISEHSEDRLPYLLSHQWLIPLAVVVGLIGLIQPMVFLWGLFVKRTPVTVRVLVILAVVETCMAFLFSPRPPTARNYYVLLPVAVFAATFGCIHLWNERRGRAASWVLALAIGYQAMLALSHFPDRSLYRDRALVAKAIDSRNYHIFGERRASANTGKSF